LIICRRQRVARIAESSIKTLLEIRSDLAEQRQPNESTYREIAENVNPDMGDWGDNQEPGGKTPDSGKYRYDSTAMNASSLTADGVQGYAFSRSNPWFRIEQEGSEKDRRDSSRGFLQIAERQMYKQLNRSSFYDEGRLLTRSIMDFATGIMFREEMVEAALPVYRALHLKRCLIGESMYGNVDILVRDFWLTPQDAAKEFGEDALPQRIKDDRQNNKVKRWKFQQFIFPRDLFDLDIETPPGKEFVSIYLADCEPYTAVQIHGYETKPFFVVRFARSYDGGAWGSGSPGMLQLANIKQLNGILKDRRRLSQKIASNPIKATEGMYGKINMTPDGVSYVPPGQDFTTIPPTGSLRELDTDIADLRRAINEAYHVDFFFLLSQNIERIKTATEASGIQGEKAAMLAAFFGRFGYEFLEPALEDLFMLELKAGRLPPPPPELQGKDIKIDFISPLYQLQKQYLQLNSTRQALAEIAALVEMQVSAGLYPDALDRVHIDNYIDIIAETFNMDRTVVREMADVEKMRKIRAQQNAAAMQFQVEAAKQKMQNDRMKAIADTVNKTKDLTPEQAAQIAGGAGRKS